MRIESLTFFRFVAAFIVVIFHYGQRTDIARLFSPFIMSGPQMVSFFFCLSGFVLMISHYEKRKEALRSYYVSRVARIVPVYMLGLLIMVYFRYGSENNGLLSLFLSGAFLQSWFPPYALTFNGPGWSLSVEAFFYATFPLIVFILRSSAIHPVKFSAISLLIYCFTQLLLSNLLSDRFDNAFGSALFDLIYYFPLSHYCSFLLGVAGGYIVVIHRQRFQREGVLPFLLMLAALGGSYLLLQYPDKISALIKMPVAFASSFYAPAFIITIMSVAYSVNFITKAISLPIFVLLGESSYALYILQQPVYTAFQSYISPHFQFHPNTAFFLYSVILIITAILVFRVVERPAQRYILSLNRRIGNSKDRRFNPS